MSKAKQKVTPVWRCCGCGAESLDRIRNCECTTNSLYEKGNTSNVVRKIDKPLAPFAEEYPAPWRIHSDEVIDRDNHNVITFDEDQLDFWSAIVRCVNTHSDLVKALEEARNSMRGVNQMHRAGLSLAGENIEAIRRAIKSADAALKKASS